MSKPDSVFDRVLRRGLVIMLTVAVSIGVALAIPTAASVAASYFTTTKIVTRDLTSREAWYHSTYNVWCPRGWRVTGGGNGGAGSPWDHVEESHPLIKDGRQGWSVTASNYAAGSSDDDSDVVGKLYAVCIR